jgi:amidohydrolase
MLAGLAQKIASDRPVKGRAVLLFQHAEEVGEGAHEIVESDEFIELNPDYIFGLHNIPGIAKNQIVLKSGSFAAASKGMTIKLIGKTAHAGEPENGISPAMAISKIIQHTNALVEDKTQFQDMVLLTVIHVKLGEIAFGTAPGYAEVRITLRANENQDMEKLEQKTEKIIRDIARTEKLTCNITYTEIFPATFNDEQCTEWIKEAVKKNNFTLHPLAEPFRWSEDFGYYSARYKSGFFGLGSGEKQPQLHNPDYNFPDDIMETGIQMFYSLYQKILK